MAFSFTSSDTLILTPSGGAQIQLFGAWPLVTPIYAYIGPTGTNVDPVCYSGRPGNGSALYALQTGVLVCYAPLLPGNLTTANLFLSCAGQTYLSPNLFTVLDDQFYTQVYSLRSVLNPKWAVGPRNIESETPP